MFEDKIYVGDALEVLKTFPDKIVQTCVTSPPYFGLRDYGEAGQIGLEKTPEEFVHNLVEVFREVHRVLKDDGTLWLNLGDTYAAGGMGPGSGKQLTNRGTSAGGHMNKARPPPPGFKQKDLIGIPWMVAFALRADGWYLRQDIIWAKPNPMPESVKDRCCKSHEYIFLLSKSPKYHFDHEAIREPAVFSKEQSLKFRERGGQAFRKKGGKTQENYGDAPDTWEPDGKRNKRSVWHVPIQPYKGAHFATFPIGLITPCILAGAPENSLVLDPFMGSGTTAFVAKTNRRKYLGIELNPEYIDLIKARLDNIPGNLDEFFC